MNKNQSLAIILPVLIVFSCFLLAESKSTAEPESMTGVEGVISVGPSHGGPARIGVPDSRPLANTDFVVNREDRTATSFKTDEQGRFRILLAPGHYTVSMKDRKGGIGNYGPFQVDVVPGQITKVQWQCDTGMR